MAENQSIKPKVPNWCAKAEIEANDANTQAREEAERDMALYGVGFLMIRPEGDQRLDPTKVVIREQ